MIFSTSSCCHRAATIQQARNFFAAQSARDDGLALVVYPQSLTLHEIRQVAGAAFGGQTAQEGNVILLYALQHLQFQDDADRQAVAQYAMGFVCYEAICKHGMVIGLRDTHTGQVKAVVVFREYQPAKENRNIKPGLLAKISTILTMIQADRKMKKDPLGLPPSLQDKNNGKAFEAGFEAVDAPLKAMFHEWHCQYAPSEPHWYVNIMATHCDFQRQGYGQKLMSVLSQAANECQMACYLESVSDNEGFYQKQGYETIKGVTMDFSCELLGDLSTPAHLMTRRPKK